MGEGFREGELKIESDERMRGFITFFYGDGVDKVVSYGDGVYLIIFHWCEIGQSG